MAGVFGMVQYIDMERAYEIIKRLGSTNNGGITVLNKGQLEMALDRPKTRFLATSSTRSCIKRPPY